jgi:hypothetical protein
MTQSGFIRMVLSLFFIASVSSCTSEAPCNPGMPKKIQTIYLRNNQEVSYVHEVEIKGISLRCDSATVMSIVSNYIASTTDKLPIDQIQLFKTSENFDQGESLSQPAAYLHDRVITIYFNRVDGSPNEFAFYDEGPIIYQGPRWKR